ncbi:MAG: transcriptional repressor [Proteobacteria bacterium]|nr:MAG: transcriptional repressor [Pseudomonadota bacterium]
MLENFDELRKYCEQLAIHLTNQQELILQIVYEHDTGLTSNDILKLLQCQNPTANRMTIYRAIEYLLEQKLIHKIQSNNTYTICKHPSDHSCQILVCTICGQQQEIHSHQICAALDNLRNNYGFAFSNPLEITGICHQCRQRP